MAKKKILNVVDFRKYPLQCPGPNSEENCFLVEKIVNSVMFVAGTYVTIKDVKRLIAKSEVWTVNIRAPRNADFAG